MSRNFPNLPLIDYTVEQIPQNVIRLTNKTVFVLIQHMLESTGSLIEKLIELGVPPKNIFCLGKNAYASRRTPFSP